MQPDLTQATGRFAALARFRELHEAGTFVMPNPHDVGAAKLLTAIGFPALATTSQGCANALGQLDGTVTREQLVAHVRAVCAATTLPVNVDSERCFPDDEGGVARCVELLAAAGAAGCSIEDWNPVAQRVEPIELATRRVAEAVAAARRVGMVVTARAENLIRGVADLDDTTARLAAYANAGADVVYAPGLVDLEQIRRVVTATPKPLNVLMLPGGPGVSDLAACGVRRISLGSVLSSIAYGAFAQAAQRLLAEGTLSPDNTYLPRKLERGAFSSS